MDYEELPLISVVTPSFNQGKYVRATIQSVISQNYPALEYLVVDGGSTDETIKVLESFGDHLIWITEEDRGQADAINKGWQRAKGTIFAWLNADDYYYTDILHQVAKFFLKHPEVDIVYGECDFVDQSANFLSPYPTKPYDMKDLLLSAINFIPQPATFIRSRVIDRIGYLDASLHYVMDFDYWLRAGLDHKIMFMPIKLAALRIHDEAKSIASLGNFADELVFIYQRFFNSPGLPESLRAISQKAMENVYYRAADCAFWAGKLKESRNYARKSWRLNTIRPRRLWLYLLLGKLGHKIANRTVGNPYLIRSLV